MRREATTGAAAAVTLLALLPATALADKVIEAQTVWRFDAMSYTMDQGEPLLFRNADAVSPGPHDVTASDKGADGKPLFASKTIPGGQEAPVEGARQLRTGSYEFFCSVHSFMQATLVVTDKGTPVPPPGGGPPPPPPPPPPQSPPPAAGAPDTRRPGVSASLPRTSLRKALKKRSFTALVTADEKVALRLRLTARVGRRTIVVGSATGTVAAPGARASVAVRIGRPALRALRRARRASLTLAVEGRDDAGNVGTATARRRVK